MSVLYADTSALVGAYFADEPDHAELRAGLLESRDVVVTSELTRLEFASAVAAAARAGRGAELSEVTDRFDLDCGPDGVLSLLRLDPSTALPLAHRLVSTRSVRTLDALHLAVALTDGPGLAELVGEPFAFVTRDRQQAQAARDEGLDVR